MNPKEWEIQNDMQWLQEALTTLQAKSVSSELHVDNSYTDFVNEAQTIIKAKIQEREQVAYECGRVAEAGVCAETKRHDETAIWKRVDAAVGKGEPTDAFSYEDPSIDIRNGLRAEIRGQLPELVQLKKEL